MVRSFRREIPVLITVGIGLFLLINRFFIIPSLANIVGSIMKIGAVLANVAIGIGPLAITILHASRIRKKAAGQWPYSLWLLLTMFGMIVVGLLPPMAGHPLWEFLFEYGYSPLQTTIYSISGFYIVSAAYRAFKVRTAEASIMLVSAMLVLIGTTSMFVYLWPGWSAIRTWIMDVPNTAAWRGFGIGTAIGAVGLGLRVLIGIEKGYGVGSE